VPQWKSVLSSGHSIPISCAGWPTRDRYGFDLIGIADTPGNAMDSWVAATMVANAAQRPRLAICVSNLVSRHPVVSAAAIVRWFEAATVLPAGQSGYCCWSS
jgi:hypothetical protein